MPKKTAKSASTSKLSQEEQKRRLIYVGIILAVAVILSIIFTLFPKTYEYYKAFMGITEEPPATEVVLAEGEQPGTGVTAEAPAPAQDNSWWEVYFTMPDQINDPNVIAGSIEEKLIERINKAKKSIHIAAFEFNLEPVADALIAAVDRGVEVQWVTDNESGIEADLDDGLDIFPKMEDGGVGVKDDGRSALMHNKFWIFDGEVVWTGSTNITQNGMFRNNNNVIVIHSPELAAIYENEFQEMWSLGEFGTTSTSSPLAEQHVVINGTDIQALFAAEDEAMQYIIPLVENAKHQIVFMAFSFTQEELGQAMLQRAENGVEVTGIFEKRGSETEYSRLTPFYCAGLKMRQDGNPGTFHHKVIIIDGEIVITGSLNFSENADSSNDENVLVIKNKDIAALYLEEFDRRWSEGEEPDPGDITCP
jgi:phosphatidylserine/phosphatidylglycerophosphate/cardiolipin synthase-like enzyme